MYNFTYECFSSYLKNKGIKLVDNIQNVNYELNEQNIINQLFTISEFDKIASNYDGIELKSLNNKTGVYVEKLKLKLRILKKYVNNIMLKKTKSQTEKVILETCFEKLKDATEAIECIKKCDYLDLLRRIMMKQEICIVDNYFNNITRMQDIMVVNLEKCEINLCEIDCIVFLKKVKRKKTNIDFVKIIKEYCKYNGLNTNSEIFIKAILSYPYEYVKWCNKYRIGKSNLNEDQYTQKIMKAIKKDDINLL